MQEKKTKEGWGNILWLSSLGLNLVLSMAVGFVIGLYLDKWFKTKPVFLMIFLALGLFAGFRQLFKEARKANDIENKEHPLH
jgi:ATP synthase protein I